MVATPPPLTGIGSLDVVVQSQPGPVEVDLTGATLVSPPATNSTPPTPALRHPATARPPPTNDRQHLHRLLRRGRADQQHRRGAVGSNELVWTQARGG